MRWLRVAPAILPPPSLIARSGCASWRILFYHAQTSVLEIALGLVLGAGVAVLLAAVFHLSDVVRALLEPYLVVSQLAPKAALAPLFLIWFGFGMKPKVLIAALVCFFPTFINTFQGLSAHDRDLELMMRCLRAGRWTILFRLQLPFAVPYITAGLKASALLSVVGCIVAEFVGTERGLGFLLLQAEAQIDTPFLFAVLATLVAVGALFYAVPATLERTILSKYMPSRASSASLLDLH